MELFLILAAERFDPFLVGFVHTLSFILYLIVLGTLSMVNYIEYRDLIGSTLQLSSTLDYIPSVPSLPHYHYHYDAQVYASSLALTPITTSDRLAYFYTPNGLRLG